MRRRAPGPQTRPGRLVRQLAVAVISTTIAEGLLLAAAHRLLTSRLKAVGPSQLPQPLSPTLLSALIDYTCYMCCSKRTIAPPGVPPQSSYAPQWVVGCCSSALPISHVRGAKPGPPIKARPMLCPRLQRRCAAGPKNRQSLTVVSSSPLAQRLAARTSVSPPVLTTTPSR